MDSLIHYRPHDTVRVLEGLAQRTEHSLLFTFAPRTAALNVMHAVGRMFPRTDRAPAIEPVGPRALLRLIQSNITGWVPAKTSRISRGFYISQALEVVPR
jgi:magnesium-protoporphyrin O-methyltransferase